MQGRDQSSTVSEINLAPNYALDAQQHPSPPEPEGIAVSKKYLHVN